jgi:hypothetical protein
MSDTLSEEVKQWLCHPADVFIPQAGELMGPPGGVARRGDRNGFTDVP